VPSTAVHFPAEILQRIDAVARRRGISRNRFVIQACESAVASDSGEWPEGFFTTELEAADRALLDEATQEMERAILQARRNRGTPLL